MVAAAAEAEAVVGKAAIMEAVSFLTRRRPREANAPRAADTAAAAAEEAVMNRRLQPLKESPRLD